MKKMKTGCGGLLMPRSAVSLEISGNIAVTVSRVRPLSASLPVWSAEKEGKNMAYYTINEAAARRSKEMRSYSDYKAGSATAEYRQMVDEATELAERQKKRVDPMHHDKIDALLDQYCRRLAANINKDNEIGTRCPSVLIAGASNFPVRKKQKQVAAWERNHQDYKEVQAILDKIRSVGMGGISSDDPNALDKLRHKLEKLEKHQESMKAANAAIRMKDKTKGDAKLKELGYSPEEIQKLREPDFCGRIGYPSFELTNNNANIRRIRGRIAELEKRQTEAPPEGWTFNGGKVEVNTAENRLQIFFDGKPEAEVRETLKRNGFRWAPSQGAWQRQLTNNALWAAKHIKAITPISSIPADAE